MSLGRRRGRDHQVPPIAPEDCGHDDAEDHFQWSIPRHEVGDVEQAKQYRAGQYGSHRREAWWEVAEDDSPEHQLLPRNSYQGEDEDHRLVPGDQHAQIRVELPADSLAVFFKVVQPRLPRCPLGLFGR